MARFPTLISTSESLLATSYNSQRKLVRLSNGTLYVVYVKELSGYDQIYVKKSVNDGITWTDETRISTYSGMNVDDQSQPSIAVDSNNYLHVVWRGEATGYISSQIWYRKYTTSWLTIVRLSTLAGMDDTIQWTPVIAVDSNNYLHVVWTGGSTAYPTWRQVWYRKYISSWGTVTRLTTLVTTSHPGGPCVTVDSNNYVHVVWAGRFGTDTWSQIYYTKYISSWSTPLLISTYSGMDSYGGQDKPCIAVDSNDYLHVVWYGKATGFTTDYQIWYAEYTGSWITPVRISTYGGMADDPQQFPSIAVNTNDDLYVLWHGKATGYTDQEKVWYVIAKPNWGTPMCRQPTGKNTYPTIRWSRYPSSNQITDPVDYVFTEGTTSLYDIMFDYNTIATAVTTQYAIIFGE